MRPAPPIFTKKDRAACQYFMVAIAEQPDTAPLTGQILPGEAYSTDPLLLRRLTP